MWNHCLFESYLLYSTIEMFQVTIGVDKSKADTEDITISEVKI